MSRLRIVADRNIAFVAEAFGSLGDVTLVRGRELDAAAVADADVLLCRSTVKVNEALLGRSRVRFVGTATVGTDHVDTAWLAGRGIGFASAEGSSTGSVAEWVLAALLFAARRRGRRLRGARLGSVGVGRVGGRVLELARVLGMTPVLSDPPRARREGPQGFAPLEEALGCDYVTLHVPLSREGEDATFHLIGESALERLGAGVLLNAARGQVVDGAALLERLSAGRLGGALLDCWEGEPRIDPALLARVELGTPHIAGHAIDAKAEGTRMLHEAARRFLGASVPAWSPETLLPAPRVRELVLSTDGVDDEDLAWAAVRAAYDIVDDDARLRASGGALFDSLRETYPPRRQLAATAVQLVPPRPSAVRLLGGLGFSVSAAAG